MDAIIEQFLPRIKEIIPRVNIESITYDGDGLVNHVFHVNDDTVVRFARGDYGIKALAVEVRILGLLQPHLSLQIPRPFYTSQDAVAYQRIPGETLSLSLVYRLSSVEQQAVADQLGGFLRALHNIPVDASLPVTLAPVRLDDWLEIRQEVEELVTPLLIRHQKAWVGELFDGMLSDATNFEYQPCLIHGDLGPYHILYNRELGRLQGIIDFGVAGLGDPATDLGNLLSVYGERFVKRTYESYPEARIHMPRARFYAQAIELQWALSGLRSGDPAWFLAHIGGARDIEYE
jgi:aminoglycoside 2''-phosphotransferase